MARILSADSVVLIIPLMRPPMPTEQNILPKPSFVNCLAALSAISPTSAAPLHAKINLGPPEQEHEFS
jgi:hypothetical protein